MNDNMMSECNRENVDETFRQLLVALRKCRTYCPWTSGQTVNTYAKQILGEAEEVQLAVKNNDMKNLKEELGDVLWDTLMVAHIAEDQGLFKVSEIMGNVVEKMKRRKPFAFEERHVSMEDAKKVWHEAKEKEKMANSSGNGT